MPEPAYPGQAFADQGLSYADQMRRYAEQRQLKRQQRQRSSKRSQALHQLLAEVENLRTERRRQRQARRASDEQWRQVRTAHAAQGRARRQRSSRLAQQAERQAYQAALTARRQELAQRRVEEQAWHQLRQSQREREAQLRQTAPPVTLWLAILVIVDSCTRQCLGLPLFVAGTHVTAELVVAALRTLLPPGLQFLISDNGQQFIADAFAALAHTAGFIHVRVAPHRPRTNGIAERFVQTLKDLLEGYSWQLPAELEVALDQIRPFYNERPHQGAELKGLSPNEYARRLALCSTC
jgi:transposase InsO family protein